MRIIKRLFLKIFDAYLKDVENIDFIIFAYEPIAICTGTLPTEKN